MIFIPDRQQPYSVLPIKSTSAKTLESPMIEIIQDMEGLGKLRSDWNEAAPFSLVEPWQSYSWMEAAASSYSEKQLLRIVTIRKNRRLAAVAPLVLKRSEQPLKPWRMDFLGGEELREPNQLISSDSRSLDLLVDVIASERVYPVRLSRIPVENGIADHIQSKFRKAGWITSTLSMPYPYLNPLGNPIKKRLKQDLRRAERRAEKYGKLRLEVVNANEKEKMFKYLEKAFQIEASGWKGRNRTAILSNPARREFFERYACSASNEGALRLSFLFVAQEAVAVHYAVETKKSYWLLNIGYNEDYHKCSPGNLLLKKSIKEAEKNGLTCYNLLGKVEPWTKRWTSTVRDCIVLAAYRPNLQGVKAMLSDAFYLMKKKDRRFGIRSGKAKPGQPVSNK